MSWERYRSVMERNAIKTDDMASEDAYFMATHIPFSQLEVYYGGRVSSEPTLMSEEEVFEKLICNPDNEHRMVIVRGDNGTGKSHLIRYLKAKFENSVGSGYSPSTEQIVFLRRLNNSVRGALSQLLEQHVIVDPEVEGKLRKFVASTDSKDKQSFLNDILYSYVSSVRSDLSGKVYKPVICRNIAAFLSDSRISEHLLRDGGAISRCYEVITASSDSILRETTVFSEDDFNQNRIIRSVIKQGDPQAVDFASSIKGDEDEIDTLVKYLNTFTRDVVQRCADISSESTKNVFVQMRKDLKRQGKNLTLFIEDFTGFTGIDSELITVLSTEHGGDYIDLCRVTAVIGITNDYYDQFRDNFTDRVTHQISVTDLSFGTDEFLLKMAGHYQNAIFCDPDKLRAWEQSGAALADLPISSFKAPCAWDSVDIGGHEVTLYPFNRHALLTLYDALPVRSPRMYLKNVIRAQLKEYFDGKEYGEEWDFPHNSANIQMSRDPHSSAIDRLQDIPASDKNRLKAIFAIWGNGTATGLKGPGGIISFGGVDKAFLDDVGLSAFQGIGVFEEVKDENAQKTPAEEKGGTADNNAEQTGPEVVPEENETVKQEETERKIPVDGATKNYRRNREDISNWFTNNEPLRYDDDYRSWLRTLIHGDGKQCGAINWQDIGVPAYIAEERLSDLAGYYIEDQKNIANSERSIVRMERSVESRDALLALNEMNYAKGWDFDGSAYYQQRLITWLEKHKEQIIENVACVKPDEPMLPVLDWCLALQYLKACIFGWKLDLSSPLAAASSLLQDFTHKDGVIRDSKEWNDLVQFLDNKNADFETAKNLLVKSSFTIMGAIRFSIGPEQSLFYRTDELIHAVERLMKADWDIEALLPQNIPRKNLLYRPADLLKTLYSKVKIIMTAENRMIGEVYHDLTALLGSLDEDSVISTINAIQGMFSVFAENGVIGRTDLKTKYEKAPVDIATSIMQHIQSLNKANNLPYMKRLKVYAQNDLHALIEFKNDLQSIAEKARAEENNARKAIMNSGVVPEIDKMSQDTKEALIALYNMLEEMEV